METIGELINNDDKYHAFLIWSFDIFKWNVYIAIKELEMQIFRFLYG